MGIEFSSSPLSGSQSSNDHQFSNNQLSSIDDNRISSPGPQAVSEEETSSSREGLVGENLAEDSRGALGSSGVAAGSSGEDLTADNLVEDGTRDEADNLFGAEEEGEEEVEADLSESRRFVREEEVTSEREQTLRNIIDEGKASEEIGGGEEEGGEPFVESLLDRQHQKPGIQGNHDKFPNQNKKSSKPIQVFLVPTWMETRFPVCLKSARNSWHLAPYLDHNT